MASNGAGKAATDGDDDKKQSSKERVLSALFFNTFQAVIQHCLVIQADQTLFLQANGGDAVRTAASLATTTSLVSVVGVLVNQLGGKLSDSFGRRPIFMVGPIVNMLVGILVFRHSTNLRLIMGCRVAKMVVTTLSGTVMTGAAMGETVQGVELAAAASRLTSYVGIAVVLAPFLESAILKRTAGSARSVYLGLTAVSAAQLLSNAALIPETLKNPRPFNTQETIAALNPLSALQIFRCKNADLKKLVSVWLLMMSVEGKNISDLAQLWMRDHVKWSPDTMRNWVSWYGAVVTAGGLYVTPFFLKRLSPLDFTAAACSTMTAGFTIAGLSERGACWWGFTVPQVLGINGATAAALVPIMRRFAAEEGFGQGEFEAYRTNLRAISGAMIPVLIAWAYGRLKAKGLSPGVIWIFLGWFCNALPAVVLRLIINREKMVL